MPSANRKRSFRRCWVSREEEEGVEGEEGSSAVVGQLPAAKCSVIPYLIDACPELNALTTASERDDSSMCRRGLAPHTAKTFRLETDTGKCAPRFKLVYLLLLAFRCTPTPNQRVLAASLAFPCIHGKLQNLTVSNARRLMQQKMPLAARRLELFERRKDDVSRDPPTLECMLPRT